ncbi:MAG: protein kinase, partial [Catenulispora sp.]|nr:protein kinase [Catenulispora sp.]
MDANRPVPGPAGSFGGLGAGSIVSRNIQPLLDADPRQIGPYAIHGRLGQGAMGHVFLGFAANGPAYALKVLRPDFAADRDFRRRFTREIAAARAVHSPFVNAVTDADPTAATPWLASYFIPGPPLSSAVQLAGPFTPRSVAHLCVGIGLALQAIHTAGIVHRDLKPANVLVASDGPRVIDFGIARAVDASMLTSTGMRLGTPSFMAPEQVAGSDVGAPADVWAVGGMLVYAATGRTAFGDGNAMSILYRVEHHDPNLEGLEPALAHIARACLAKDPAARPTPAQLVEMCRAALDGGGMGIPALPGTDVTGWLPPAVSRDLASRQVELASIRQTQGPAAGVAPGAPAVGGAATIPGGSKGGGLGGFLRRKGGGQGQGQQPATAPTGVPGQTAGPWTQGAATGTPAGQTGGGQYGAAMSSTGGQYGPGSTGGAGQGPGGAGQSPGQPGPDGTGGGQPVWGTAGQSAAPGTPGTQPPQPVWGTAPSQAPQPVWGTAGPAPAPGNAQPAWGAAGQTPAPGQPPQPVWGTADQAPASSNAQPAWGAAPAAPSGQTPQPVWGTAGQAPASGQPASDNPQPAWGTASQSAAPGQAPQPVWGQNPAPAQGPAPDGPAWGPSGPSGSDMPTIVAPLSSPTPADPQAPAWVSASAANAAAPSEADQPVAPSNPWDDEPHTPAVAGLPPGFTPIGQEAKKLAEVAETPEPAESEPAEPGRASAGPAATAESAASAESAEPDQPAEPDSPAADAESPALADVDAAFGPAKPALSGPGIPSIAPPTFATEFNIPAVKPDAAEPEAKAASIGVPQIAPPTFATEFNIPAVKPSDSAPESDDTATAPPASSSVGIPSIAPPTFATEFNIPAVTPNDPAPDSENAAPAAAAAPASSSIGVPSIAPPTFATEFNIPAVKPADPAPESDDAAPAASTAASSTPAASTAPAWTPGASTPSPASSSSQSAAPTAPSPSPSVGIPSIAPPTFATEFNIPAVTPNDSALDATAPTPKPTIDVPSIAPPTFATEFNIPAVTPNDSALDETAQTAKPAVSVPSIADPAWATGFGIPDPALPADDAPSDSDLASTARTDTGPTPDAWSPAPPTAPATPPPAADTPPPASPIQHAPPIPPHLQQPMTPPKSFTAHSSAP